MPETVSLNMLYEKVGEVGAIAREAKHAANNASNKIDALALIVTAQGRIEEHVERLERDRQEDHKEIEELKADKYRRQGAIGVAEAFRRFWPLLPFAGIMAFFIAWANGRLGS